MKSTHILAITAALLAQSTLARAGEEVIVAPVPAWVTPAPALDPRNLPKGEGVVPLFDEQGMVEGDTSTLYVEGARVIATANDLQKSGTLAFDWQPDHGDFTMHRLEILRDGETIDLLRDGSGFTVLRREAQLQNRMMTGELTAVRQIEGLRVGDVLHFAMSVTERDPVLKGKVQTGLVLIQAPLRMGFGRARLVWPADMPLQLRSIDGIDLTPKLLAGGYKEVSISLPIAKAPDMPKNVPSRFQPQPLVYATDFSDWSEVAAVMAPHFDPQGTIPEGSDLARAIDTIAAGSSDPVERLAAALRIAQSDVRYLAVSMGSGNYVPQTPMETWEKRYGDCKAKTMLLLAMLQRLGITAEAVLASSSQGDRLPSMLPAPQDFDHVFVRAEIAGESFWLDGTNLGSRLADIRNVPRLGYVLPLRREGATLVELPLRANARPSPDISLVYDATASIHLPMPFALDITYTGAEAEKTHADILAGGDEKLEDLAEAAANTWADSKTILKPTSTYDAEAAALTLHIKGIAYPYWEFKDGSFQMDAPGSLRVVFDPDRSRSAWKPLPALIEGPWTAHEKVTLRLPAEAAGAVLTGTGPGSLDVPAVSYSRTVTRDGATIVEEVTSRETGAEVPSKDVAGLRKAVADVRNQQLGIAMPKSYPLTWSDAARLRKSPGFAAIRAFYDQRAAEDTTDGYRLSDRGWLEEQLYNWDKAEEFYTRAIALEPAQAFYVSRSRVRETAGNDAGALEDAQAAYDLDSSNDDARYRLAYELGNVGRVDEGLALIDASPEVTTDKGLQAVIDQIGIMWRGKKFADAADLVDRVLPDLPNSAALLNARCWSKAQADTDIPGALADCDRAVAMASETADYLDSRALAHFRADEMEQAKADLDAALALEPEVATYYFLRGVVAKRLGSDGGGDLAAARAMYPGVDDYFGGFGIKP